MGLYDRDYTREKFHSSFRYSPQMRFTLPKTTPVVKKLLIINITVFFATMIIRPFGDFLFTWFSLYPTDWATSLQLWRLVTYQFLHGGFWHILVNMWVLWMFGSTLERPWGGKRFLYFYLGCGVAGGLFYLLLVAVGFLPAMPMVGASGAILGVLAACAILFPGMAVFLLPFPFPIPIRFAAVGLTVLYVFFVVTKSENAGGHAAHLAGMAAGAFYVLSQSWRNRLKLKIQNTRSQRKIADQRSLQVEVDRILEKVHNSGIQSLTPKEKRILRQATKGEQARNRF
ncbi:MAG: rhomboid family intramembrane serine protease [Planctomycetota bacterium]|jgi:membrane associated rhomboid family serine protease